MDSKWKTIVFCTCYNLLFEFSVRGISGFINRFLCFWLFWVYFAFFNLIVYISIKSWGSDRAIFTAAATFGIIPATFVTGVIFINADLLGVNPLIFIIDMFIWWPILQTWFPLYMSGKLFGKHIVDGKIGRICLILCLIYIAGFTIIAFLSSIKGILHGYIIVIISFILLFLWTLIEIRKVSREGSNIINDKIVNEENFFKSKLLDFGFYVTVIISLFSGLIIPLYDTPIGEFHTYPISIWVMSFWSLILMLIALIYKFKEKKPFPLPR